MEEFRVYIEQIGNSSIWTNPSILLIVGALVGIIPSMINRIIDNTHMEKMLELERKENNKKLTWSRKEEAYITITNYIDEIRTELKINDGKISEEINSRIKEKYIDKFAQFNIYASSKINKHFEDKEIFNMDFESICIFKEDLYELIREDLGIYDQLY